LMGLLGAGMRDGVKILQWMCVVVLVRTISTAMSPLIVVARRQSRAAWLTMISLSLQIAGLWALVPRFGAMGAVASCFAVGLLTGAVARSWIGQKASGSRLDWSVALRLMACCVVAIVICLAMHIDGSLFDGRVCGLIYLTLAFATGSVS